MKYNSCYRFVFLVASFLLRTTAFDVQTLSPHLSHHRIGKPIGAHDGLVLFAKKSLLLKDDSADRPQPEIRGDVEESRVALFRKKALSKAHRRTIRRHLIEAGLWGNDGDDDDESADMVMTDSAASQLLFLAEDFVDRPEAFSAILINDFCFPVLAAHQTRAVVMATLKQQREHRQQQEQQQPLQHHAHQSLQRDLPQESTQVIPTEPVPEVEKRLDVGERSASASSKQHEQQTPQKQKFSYMNTVIVNQKSKQRREQTGSDFEYALPSNYKERYPLLASEIHSFEKFMTQPSTYSQEAPIRLATAEVYLRHVRLFLGYYVNVYTKSSEVQDGVEAGSGKLPYIKDDELSIFQIIPDKEKESASIIIEFIQWLRSYRSISVSYEANVLRGLIKMLKYRFAQESESESERNTFDDIPIIKELRKLHRYANQRTKLAPRSSNEENKWITWPEFLHVTECIKQDVLKLIGDFKNMTDKKIDDQKCATKKVHVAEAYQRWLILAIFANIPDRQRTIREIEIGRTLMKDYSNNANDGRHSWIVKHTSEDYKTGGSYGDRPAMQLSPELTPAIDDFIENWRPALKPTTNLLFVQARTGKPMTGDSVFQRVSRCCFKYTGKRTNPHLLRDMLVTHVRESDASEKQLEALALYMGHSIHMQRTSYDRRTLSSKVAPAVELMQSVNSLGNVS